MPVRYIDVRPISSLFVGATRAYGDLAIIGQCGAAATAPVAAPQPFTDPASAAAPFAGDVATAIELAFRQTPGPTTVWGVRVASQNPDWAAALTEVAKLDVQIVALADVPLTAATATTVEALATHVNTVSKSGGDGKERIGVAMLAKDATDPSVVSGNLVEERMVYVAHRATEDAGAAVAGVIAGYEPHISMLLKPVSIADQAGVNWLTDPVLFPGRGMYMGEGYTGNIGGTKKYIDIVRTLDAISFEIKANLIEAIGNFRVSRSGLRSIVTIVRAVLSPMQAREVIENYVVHIPLLVLLDKDPASLSDDEIKQIDKAQADRRVDMVVTVDYAGAIHRLRIDLVFK
jgi:hypothetical protein